MITRYRIIIITLGIISLTSSIVGQNDYNYEAKVNNIQDGWNEMEIPANLYKQADKTLKDIRLSSSSDGKTKEIPFFIKTYDAKTKKVTEPLEIINRSTQEDAFFYTMKVFKNKEINKISLEFKNQNFDWKTKLEGSNDNSEWFTILDDYRLLGINVNDKKYKQSELDFPTSTYKFYRLSIPTKDKVDLHFAFSIAESTSPIVLIPCPLNKFKVVEKQDVTEVIVDFKDHVPVSNLSIDISGPKYYKRSANITYLVDSIRQNKKWLKRYFAKKTVTINSEKASTFQFNPALTNSIKLIIQNNDNEPLVIEGIKAWRYKQSIIAELNSNENVKLQFGNKALEKPRYDIEYFKNEIPENINQAILEAPKSNIKTTASGILKNPLFLYGIMGLVIILLGYFTFKMMSDSKN